MFFRSKNTTKKGQVRCIVFREGIIWYGVALEFNLVVDAATKTEAFTELDLAMKDYIETARVHRLRDLVLNQDASSEYSHLWKDLIEGREPKLKKIDEEDHSQQPALEVAFFGYRPQLA